MFTSIIGMPIYERDLQRSRNGFWRIITPHSRVFIPSNIMPHQLLYQKLLFLASIGLTSTIMNSNGRGQKQLLFSNSENSVKT